MKFRIVSIFLLLLPFTTTFAASGTVIEWLTLEQAIEKQKEHPKKIIIDAYTDWCGWCKQLDRTTFADKNIASYINTNYYAVKFNAETTDTIEYLGQKYYNTQAAMLKAAGQPTRKATHDLAYKLMGQRLSYPTLIYMDDSAHVIAPIGGYYSAFDIQPLLIYFAEDLQYSTDLQEFIDDFKYTYVDSLRTNVDNIKWLTIDEAIKRCETQPKKIVLCMDSPWATTSKIMFQRVFNDKEIADYINKNMYPVRFDITSQDSVVFSNYTFKNQSTEHPYHDFAVRLLNGNMRLPATIFFNEDLRPITNTAGYFSREGIMPVLQYFNDDHYKTTQWSTFIKQYHETKVKDK